MYVCMYFVCMYVCMYACTYVCMYVCRYVRMYLCMYVCTYVSMYLRLYVSGYVDAQMRTCRRLPYFSIYIHECLLGTSCSRNIMLVSLCAQTVNALAALVMNRRGWLGWGLGQLPGILFACAWFRLGVKHRCALQPSKISNIDTCVYLRRVCSGLVTHDEHSHVATSFPFTQTYVKYVDKGSGVGLSTLKKRNVIVTTYRHA